MFFKIFRAKTVPKIDPKITQKSTSAPQGLPETAREPFWNHFGAIFGPSGASFSKVSGRIVYYFLVFLLAFSRAPSSDVRRVSAAGSAPSARWPVLGRQPL